MDFDFNSIKVRLERNWLRCRKALIPFQFHKGAIRTMVSLWSASVIHNFNSIKVRLEPAAQMGDRSLYSDFNSIKVRLELHLNQHFMCILLFQFHKGAIRT